MTIALIDNPTRTASSLKSDSLDLKNDKDSSSQGSEFGQVMSEVMTPESKQGKLGKADDAILTTEDQAMNGQALAEAKLGISGLYGSLGGDLLKAVNLGPHLSVITPETAAPDEQSLEAFARSQGLDETAVQWLMGTAPGLMSATHGHQAEGAAGLTDKSGLGAVGLLSGAAKTSTLEEISSITTSTAVTATTPGAIASAPISPAPTALAGFTPASTDVSPAPAAPTEVTAAAVTPGNEKKTGESTKPEGLVSQTALNAAALWAMAQQPDKARTMATPQDNLMETAKLQINMMPPPPPAAIWMQRNALAINPSKEPVTNKTGISLSELDLTGVVSEELLESLSQGVAESGTAATSGSPSTHLPGPAGARMETSAAARQEGQNSGADPTLPNAGNVQRSENIQNLAEKMGQAVGQRILSEIEKGQWHLKLSLRPATLGHIEVEIRMRSGEMDAVFTAPQAVTRELLQDGMSKLKDTLNQMGMDVASMQVGDGQTQKRGGESTPRQTGKITTTDVDESKSTASQSASLPRMKMGLDGWDVLV